MRMQACYLITNEEYNPYVKAAFSFTHLFHCRNFDYR